MSDLEEDPQETIAKLKQQNAELRGRLDQSMDHVSELRGEIQRFDFRLNEVSLDWKEKCAKLVNELKMLSKGAKSACACPAGQCMKMLRDSGQMCWAQWADAEARRLSATREQDAMRSAANHPSRLRIIPPPEDGKALPPP